MKLVKPTLEYLSISLPSGIWWAVWSTCDSLAKDSMKFVGSKSHVIRQLKKKGVVCPKSVTNSIATNWRG